MKSTEETEGDAANIKLPRKSETVVLKTDKSGERVKYLPEFRENFEIRGC